MLKPLFDISQLPDELSAATRILTPNRRLARQILAAWGQHCAEQGQRVWRQPAVQALDDWLDERWQELQDRAYPDCAGYSLVSPQAERLLWEKLIDADNDKPPLIEGSSFARLAQTALQAVEYWQVDWSELANSAHEPCTHWLRWRQLFYQALAEKKLLTSGQARMQVLEAFKQGFLARRPELLLVAFSNRPAPLLQAIISEAFHSHDYAQARKSRASQLLYRARNDNEEVSAAGRWAKQQLAGQADARIGLVFANLSSQRPRIERILREVFSPDYALPDSPHGVPPFNISAGQPLAETPLINAALKLLALQHSPQALSYYCELLNNPFWGDADQEQLVRAQCQVLLRRGDKPRPDSADLRAAMAGAAQALPEGDTAGHKLSRALQAFAQRCRGTSLSSQQASAQTSSPPDSQRSFSAWAEEFTTRLELLGWPGSRSLDSIEYQQQQLWTGLLNEFSALDRAADPVDSTTALSTLSRLCRERIFQPESEDSPIQVLGVLEAGGLEFDRLWLAEVHDAQWPQSPDYHPLLPVPLQRRHQMPRSSADQELSIAQGLLEDFRSHCGELVFSYGRYDGDTERQVSRLIDPELASPDPDTAISPPLPATHSQRPGLEKIPVDRAPQLLAEELPLRGGSALLRDQAGCPFNAFATWRLGAEPLPEPAFGLNPMERGILVHRALELFWAQCRDFETLVSQTPAQRDELLGHSIEGAIRDLQRYRQEKPGPRFVALEHQRLKALLTAWLELESRRQPFTVVGREEKLDFQLEELAFSLRVDRIDELNDGSAVLIDYKTGQTNIKNLRGERPEEVQLMLYALAVDKPLSTLGFGQISASKGIVFKGITDRDRVIPGASGLDAVAGDAVAGGTVEGQANWPETLALWRQRLSKLAREFYTGEAQALFYTDAALRYQNHLLPLNRALDTLSESEEDGDDAPTG